MSVRETLELDISDALASIEQVGDRLANVAQAFGEVLSEALEAALNGLPVITPEVDATPISDEVEQALTEASATPVDVTVEVDAGTISDEIEQATAEADTSVEIEVIADTSQAEAAIDSLGQTSTEATGGLSQVTEATGALDQASSLAAGGVGGLTSQLGTVGGPVGAVAAGAIAGLTLGIGTLYSGALDAVAVTQTWEQTLGPLGDRILDLSSGTTGFDTNLQTLAQTLGSSDEAVMQATQRLAMWQQSLGATDDEIVTVTQQVAVLAAQIRANNPAAGEMDAIIQMLSRSLSRGGPRLRQYGIALDATAISTRAAEQTGKALTATFTDQEKFAAGLSLALEQLGPSYQSVLEGSENAQITVERLQEKIGDTIETIGTPLVAPINDVLAAMVSLFEEIGPVIGTVVGAVVGELVPAIETMTFVFDQVNGFIEASASALEEFGLVSEDASSNLNVLADGLSGVIQGFIANAGPLGQVVLLAADIAGVLPDVADGTKMLGTVSETTATQVAPLTAEMKAQQLQLEALVAKFQPVYDEWVKFADGVKRSVPSLTEAIGQVTEETKADDITANLAEQIAATDRWTQDMAQAFADGYENIAGLLVEVGPTQSAILMEQYRGREEELENHLRLMAEAQQRAAAAANLIALRGYLEMRGITGAQANAIVMTLGAELQLGVPTQERIDEVVKAPATNQLRVLAAYGKLGTDATGAVAQEMNSAVGATISGNLIDGMTKEAYARTQRVRDALNAVGVAAIEAINAALGNRSPSREMAIVGDNAVAGLVVGINRSSGLVDAAMGGLASDVLGVNLSAGAPTIRDVTVQVPITVSGGMTADDGRAIGAAAGQAAAAEVARMMRLEARVA